VNASAGTDAVERDKALISRLQAMRNDCKKLKQRISLLGEEIAEHKDAARVLEQFDEARTCKRAIGSLDGVYCRRSVASCATGNQSAR